MQIWKDVCQIKICFHALLFRAKLICIWSWGLTANTITKTKTLTQRNTQAGRYTRHRWSQMHKQPLIGQGFDFHPTWCDTCWSLWCNSARNREPSINTGVLEELSKQASELYKRRLHRVQQLEFNGVRTMSARVLPYSYDVIGVQIPMTRNLQNPIHSAGMTCVIWPLCTHPHRRVKEAKEISVAKSNDEAFTWPERGHQFFMSAESLRKASQQALLHVIVKRNKSSNWCWWTRCRLNILRYVSTICKIISYNNWQVLLLAVLVSYGTLQIANCREFEMTTGILCRICIFHMKSFNMIHTWWYNACMYIYIYLLYVITICV